MFCLLFAESESPAIFSLFVFSFAAVAVLRMEEAVLVVTVLEQRDVRVIDASRNF